MVEIQVKVEAEKASVRNATQFLGSLVLMRDGIELLVKGNAVEFGKRVSEQFPEVFPTSGNLLGLLTAMGEIVVDAHEWPLLPEGSQAMVTETLLNALPEGEGLTFVALKRGSLEGVFEDLYDKIGKLFTDLLQTSNSIVDGGEGLEMKSGLRTILAESGEPLETQLAAGGLVMLGAEKLKRTLTAMGATNVEIEARVTAQ